MAHVLFPARWQGCRLTLAISGLLISALTCGLSYAQDDDDDFSPGLLATYSSGDHSVRRFDDSLSFDWGGAAPDERLPPGPFRAEWSGNLLARLPGTHTLHVFVAGSVTVSIDDREVLSAAEPGGFVSGTPFPLSAGDHSIRVSYATAAESDKPRARLSVFWSSDQFTLEPLPSDVLFHSGDTEVQLQDRGRHLADARRCAACHENHTGLTALKAPALDRVKGSQPTAILIKRLLAPASVVADSHMPEFGLIDSEARSIAAFLLSVSKDAQKESELKFKDGDAAAGTKLLNSLGCAACHQLPGMKDSLTPLTGLYEGPELVTIGQRRSLAWLDRWLRDPKSLNVDHRMPVFELSKDERRQLVAALVPEQPQSDSDTALPGDELVAQGRKLVAEANCAGCHQIPGMQPSFVEALTADSAAAAEPACLRSETDRLVRKGRRLPKWRLGTQAAAVQAWITSIQGHGQLSASDQGQVLLSRNGCVACHDRSPSRGLSSLAADLQRAHPELDGQSQGMIPPPLTAVGDKLNDDYLAKAVAGEQKERRLPWLLVRMPKFRHTDADRAAIVRHLITADRIPQEADDAREELLSHVDLSGQTTATTAQLLLGNQLTGAGGFNCVACHKAGPFEPRNVALGTRGSDIMTMGSRIRPRFFQRWMLNPIRVVAGIEMPAIKKAIPDVLDGSLPAQIGMMWTALSDRRFTPPTVTSRFEQVVNVEPGGTPRIIRDVFTIGLDKDRQAVARAMAVGFGNGHNILIDLDTLQLQLWTIGEFARQRTEGKSWYWDMPGTVVWQTEQSPFAPLLVAAADGSLRKPVMDEGRLSELLSYRTLPNGVELECRSWFDTSKPPADNAAADSAAAAEPHFTVPAWEDPARPLQAVVTRHRLTSVGTADAQTGWRYVLEVMDCPPEFRVAVSADSLPVPENADGIKVMQTYDGPTGGLTIGQQAAKTLSIGLQRPPMAAVAAKPVVNASSERVTSTPGFIGRRLPIDMSVMPTSMTWLPDGRMAFTSLKGHVWMAKDTDGDGLADQTTLFEEGLAAPFGILSDNDSLIVAHKPEVLRLRDTNEDGRADEREVVASGWGYNDNYHDWTTGLVRDTIGNMYVGLGSDYSQKTRPQTQDRWRGGVIRIDPSGVITPLGMSMRYPMGLAFDRQGHLFATDNQGVQNTFNEINHIVLGKHYGVPSSHQPTDGLQHETPAVMVPHPWTRSVNSILFLPDDFPVAGLRGHGIGCEYDSRFLIRFTVQDVDGTLQGASYRFSLPNQEAGGSNFIGPICSAVGPDGAIYVGSIWDSGWQGGRNTGGITRLVPSDEGLPNGIRELTATAAGFDVEFFQPVDRDSAADPANWSLQAYTRRWGGSYATPDSDRRTLAAQNITVTDDGTRVRIAVAGLQPGFLYDISAKGKLAESQNLWPAEAHYSMKVVPK